VSKAEKGCGRETGEEEEREMRGRRRGQKYFQRECSEGVLSITQVFATFPLSGGESMQGRDSGALLDFAGKKLPIILI
jgi:hypothetical protein